MDSKVLVDVGGGALFLLVASRILQGMWYAYRDRTAQDAKQSDDMSLWLRERLTSFEDKLLGNGNGGKGALQALDQKVDALAERWDAEAKATAVVRAQCQERFAALAEAGVANLGNSPDWQAILGAAVRGVEQSLGSLRAQLNDRPCMQAGNNGKCETAVVLGPEVLSASPDP